MIAPSELNDYETNKIVNEFRRVEGKYYLDHAGTTLYSEQQLETVYKNLRENLYSSPHTSKATEDIIDQVRYRILKHFNTDNSQYDVVFTSGTTASLKTIAECFDFGDNGAYAYLQENHTSVLGMRESVKTDRIFTLTREQFFMNLESTDSTELTEQLGGNNLVTFPAQCNFSGFKYPLGLIDKIQRYGLKSFGKLLGACDETKKTYATQNQCYICLDAAAFASTNFLDLNKFSPDFVCISFYKIFGYPTGLGALIVNKRGQKVLKKSYYGGGTVKIAMSQIDFHQKRECFHERFEDGTIPFLSIIALLAGFSTIDRLIGSQHAMKRIGRHVFHLAKYSYDELTKLAYRNRKPLIKIYSHTGYDSVDEQGGIITFNLLHDDGSYVGYAEVACMASIYNIVMRTGCFCNPGACQAHLKLSDDEIQKHFQAGHICGDYNDLVDGLPTGAIRISFGYMSRREDVDWFLHMLRECYLKDKCDRLNILEKSHIPQNLLHIKDRVKATTKEVRLRQICVYPIKSCGAFKVAGSWEVTAKGFRYDRCWMIVNMNGVAVTQKSNTRLCLIRPEINLKRGVMILHYPGCESIEILLVPTESQIVTSTLCQSKVCGDFIEGIDCGDEIAEWISVCLETPGLRLIQQHDGSHRLNRNGDVKDISLSNQAQFLLINYTSVTWLAAKVENWIDVDGNDSDGFVDRFRGNLIIETAEPLDENNFQHIQIGPVDFRIDGHCTRCQMICINPRTGEKTAEPLRTIAKVFDGKIRFGIYLSQHNTSDDRTILISCADEILFE